MPTRPSCAASRTCWSSTPLFRRLADRHRLGRELFGTGLPRPAGLRVGALALGICNGAYQAEVFRGGYLAVAKGEIEAAAPSGWGGPSCSAASSHRRCCASPFPASAMLAARLKDSALDLRDRPRRAAAPVAGRRRLDAPALLLLPGGGGALPRHHHRDRLFERRREPFASTRLAEGMRAAIDLPFLAKPRPASPRACRSRCSSHSSRSPPVSCSRFCSRDAAVALTARPDRARLRLRVPRHAAAGADVPDLLRPAQFRGCAIPGPGRSCANPIGARSSR